MPWVSKKRQREIQQVAADEAAALKSQARSNRLERDKDVMAAFVTLWPKHAESLRNLADPTGMRREMDASALGWLPGYGDFDAACIDKLIATAHSEKKRLAAQHAEDVEKRTIDALRSGTAKAMSDR